MTESPQERPRIVVGVDGSEPSKLALRWARRLAAVEQADIDVIGAWTWPSLAGATVVALDYSPMDDIEKELTAAVDEVVGPDRPLGLRVRAVNGGAAHVLVEASRTALLVIVGSRGLGGFMGLLLGSVSQHVAEHAACPVLVVREHNDDGVSQQDDDKKVSP
jgi:nucleotide-binding universal stress UspA family protein